VARPVSIITTVATAAFLVLLARPAPVAAECFTGPIKADEQPQVRYAFVAMVTEASDAVDPVEDMAAYDWHVELNTEQTYLGEVPPSLAYNGWEFGCHEFDGEGLRTGDRIFVATQHLHMQNLPGDPFGGDVLVWRWDGHGWTFYAGVMNGAEFDANYPKAARAATTTREIVAIVAAGALPATSVEDTTDPETDQPPTSPLLVLSFVVLVATLFALRRTGRTSDIQRR
jgi:hypothetical protein